MTNRWQSITLVVVLLAVSRALPACDGDDDDDGGANAGSGGSSGAAPGTSGSSPGGSAAAGTSGTGGVPPTVEECRASHYSAEGIDAECASCMCECDTAAASACGEDCWEMARCVRVHCGGSVSDVTCITSNCADFLGGALAAAEARACFGTCGPMACLGFFVPGSGGAGGAGGAAGTDAGGAAGDMGTGGVAGDTGAGGAISDSGAGGTGG